MKNILARHVVAVALVTLGCLFWLFHLLNGGIFFTIAMLVIIPRNELTRPFPNKDLLPAVGVLILLVAAIVVGKFVIPKPVSENLDRLITQPVTISALWFVVLWALYRSFQRQRRELAITG
ncbi:MAG: hypothetical protein JWO95_2134 [Verrucomicrobiales bacterium]|nr:hypothetical protein [Verrucomicrobiales bacterium]